ncbi:MAG: phosphatase PAP2 family protein [Anaerolineales bacterium]|jgi:undecaprenyl-diphosphatase
MNQVMACASWMVIIGLLMMIIGMLHINSRFARWDTRIFNFIYVRLSRFTTLFQYLRPLGTVPVLFLLILIMYIPSCEFGIIATISYSISAIIERIIKMTIRRPRPFQLLHGVKMGQLPEPHDPSHPSGDSFRVWFLACLLPFAFSLPAPIYVFSFIVAIILSLGRIALGVHFPLDVISGTGLGFLSSSIAVISFQIITN